MFDLLCLIDLGKRDWLIMCIIFNALLWPLVKGSEGYKRDSLDSFLYDYASKKVPSRRAGRLYKVPLPANLSGMEVSVVRLRTRSLWKNGANYSSFSIPPWTLPWPFTKRVDLVYQNLGNLSSCYYNVPNYTFLAPVISFLAYDPIRNSSNYGPIELKVLGKDPIVVKFPNVSLQEYGNVSMKCVRFDSNGTWGFSNVSMSSSCVVRRQGHFSVVIPYTPIRENRRLMKWWVVGIVCGFVGLMFLVLVAAVFRWNRGQRIKKMERQSETSEGLNTIWIGRSRMPSASGIRTQPALENSYIP